MSEKESPFAGRSQRAVNPMFSLNAEPEGVDTDEFAPKKPVSVFPARAKRPAPQSIEDDGDSVSVLPEESITIPTVAAPRVISPNSMFSSPMEDDLNLDVGVNETDSRKSGSGDVKRVYDVPRVNLPAKSAEVAPTKVAVSSPIVDDLNLNVGVNETDLQATNQQTVPVSSPAGSDTIVAPKEVVSEPTVSPVKAPVREAVRSREEVLVKDDSKLLEGRIAPQPVSPSQTVNRVRTVNPMFADAPLGSDEGLNLDIGVNETEAVTAPVKRVVSSLFSFKPETAAPKKELDPDRLPEKKRPNAMIDVADEDVFASEKAVRSKKNKSPNKRAFQVQERDIVLLRFLTKYQFSYVDAIARVLDSTPASIANRLRTLEEYDLVKRQVIAHGSTLWQARRAGIELCAMNFTENKGSISFATIRHTIGLVNLAAELEREAPGAKDILGLERYNESFPVLNRFPSGLRLYGDEADSVSLTYGEMTVSEREIRQGQKRYRGGRSSAEMRELVSLAVLNPEAPELEEGNEGLFVVYGEEGKTGEHVPDLVVTRPRNPETGLPEHFAIELELTAKSPSDWKRILRAYQQNGAMYSRIYYFTSEPPIARMLRNADESVGLGDRLVIRKYTPKNKRQPFLG